MIWEEFQPLYQRLEAREVPADMVASLLLIVRAMKARNYLNAMDIYLKLSIGNAAWPIGVTQVGIHARSAREKISHATNKTNSAHIMTDEAARKFIHGFKRLITFCQQAYPTDPSRSVDFNAYNDVGRGGDGSDLVALQAAAQRGDAPENLALPAPQHYLDKTNAVKVPDKLGAILRSAGVKEDRPA